jgi:ComF family protein
MLSRFVEDDCEVLSGIDMLTFVPMDSKGLRERGFNQSRILAEYISKRFTIPVANTLEKRLGTRRQNELSRSDRLENLNRAFSARIGIDLTGISILLIDDVMTTGATLNECALTLKNSGAAQVRCLTLARPAHSYEDNR